MSALLVEALIASSLLMALVMLLRGPVARQWGARAAYMLWALPFLRFILPPLPEATVPALTLPAGFGAGGDKTVITFVGDATRTAAIFPWVEALIVLWFVGALLFLTFQMLGYARFRRMMLSDGTIVARTGAVTLIESVHATGPLAFGVLRKYVVLPIDFADRYDVDERAMALAHEHMHHERGDLAANMVALLLLGLHWCNPIAWIAYRAFRADQELACDAQVLARHGEVHAQAYGRAILKAASGRQYVAVCHLNTIDNLKGRLKMLSHHSASLHRITWGITAVGAVTIAALALTASGSRAAQEMANVSDRVGDANLTRLASFMPDTPVLPPIPAVPPMPEMPSFADVPEAPVSPEPPESARYPNAVVTQNGGNYVAPPATPEAPEPPLPPAAVEASHRVIIREHDGKAFAHGIPTDAEIRAMVPDIRVERACGRGDPVTSTQTTSSNGKQQVRIMICNRAMAQNAAREAIKGLREARADVARETDISTDVRARILADLDRQIARMRQRQN